MFGGGLPLYVRPTGVETRWATGENPLGLKGQGGQANGGRKGAPCRPLKAGEHVVLADVQGVSGTIWRIWITIYDRSPQMLRSLRIDFYWDNCKKPAVSTPLGDFFGTGLGRLVPFESALFASPEGRSFNCFIPMPFKQGMKVVVTNEGDVDQKAIYWEINYTIGDPHGEDTLYFHAHYRRERPTTMKQDFDILPLVKGTGRYLGTNIGVICNQELYYTSWWGEGECKIYVDGDTLFPTLCGTGTEDFIGTGWGQRHFAHLYQGCHVADKENMQYCFYRYHVVDPVYFSQDIRVTMQQIGCWSPKTRPFLKESGRVYYHTGAELIPVDFDQELPDYGLYEREDDWSCCAYFYLNAPENDLPPLDDVAQRIVGL